jgi:FkbM family methyltransferase
VQRPTRDDILRRLLPDAGTVLDIGANVGQSAASFRALWPEATVHCFEPDPRNLEELRASADAGMVVNAVAVAGAETAASDFHLSSANQASGLSAPGTEYLRRGVTEVDTVQVATTTIDAYRRANALAHVDLCKIDTQGHTGPCLDGARESLAAQAISVLQIELLFAAYYDQRDTFLEVEQRLAPYGYSLYTLVDTDTHTVGVTYIDYETGELKHLDAIYVLRDFVGENALHGNDGPR